tara:strand:+ start:595 stop:1398 length:804 start_codon:yes stop_codon:yes gene_type:complete
LLTHTYQHDTVVIGGNLNALLYSYTNNLPLIMNRLSRPFFVNKEELSLWNQMFFLLSLSGLNLFGDKVEQTRVDKKELLVTTKDLRAFKVNYDKLIIFDDKNIIGLPIAKKKKDKFMVLDWITAKPCTKHDHEYFYVGDDLIKEIHFYPTNRIPGHHPKLKDLVAVSYLNSEQLQDFDYSDTYVKFKAEKILKENGITGRKNGFANGKQITYNLKLKVEKREVRKTKMDLYKNTESLEFNYSSLGTIITNASGAYASKLNGALNIIS